ncbi:hypothetical protein BHM03_00044858 [Ensete ventricosum]|nr:hypothetical protein BHM03_00044858 [Ensete ventricosum]
MPEKPRQDARSPLEARTERRNVVFFSPRSLELILPTKSHRGFFSLREMDRDHCGRTALDLQVLPFLLLLLPSPSADITQQRAVMIEIDHYRPISGSNKAELAPIGGIAQ